MGLIAHTSVIVERIDIVVTTSIIIRLCRPLGLIVSNVGNLLLGILILYKRLYQRLLYSAVTISSWLRRLSSGHHVCHSSFIVNPFLHPWSFRSQRRILAHSRHIVRHLGPTKSWQLVDFVQYFPLYLLGRHVDAV